MEAISVKNLKKCYGEHVAVKGISFQIQQGEIFALLGKNGAGKTTTLECMEGLRPYDEGEIQIQGVCGVQLQSSSLPGVMKAKEALQFFAKWQKAEIHQDYLDRIGVTPFLHQQYNQLSTGQKRRLHLAISMLHDPDILFLDEPTAGLDVEGRNALHEEIKRLKSLGKTIVIASHDMAEVEALCDSIAVMKEGSLVYLGSVQELNQEKEEGFVLDVFFQTAFAYPSTTNPTSIGTKHTFQTNNINDTLVEIATIATKQNVAIMDIKVEQASLEQRFLSVLKED